MIKKILLGLLIIPMCLAPAHAAFYVDIYDTPKFQHTDQLRTHINNHDATGSYQYDVINFSDWGNKGFFADENLWPIANKNTFSAHITGTFDILEAGDYDFASWSDDGIDLLIDGVSAINRPKPHAPTLDIANLYLTAGFHSIDVIWYENTGAAVLELSTRKNHNSGANAWQLLSTVDLPSTGLNGTIPEPNVIWYFVIGLFFIILRTRVNNSKQMEFDR